MGIFISRGEKVPIAPTDWFLEITNEILDLTDQLASVALFGTIGVGKSFVARTRLLPSLIDEVDKTNPMAGGCERRKQRD